MESLEREPCQRLVLTLQLLMHHPVRREVWETERPCGKGQCLSEAKEVPKAKAAALGTSEASQKH